MTAFTPLQLGDQIPGFVGAIATGSTQADAVPITSKLTIFTTVDPGTGCVLPSTGASHIAVQIINNGANSLSVYPAGAGQIDALGASQPYTIPASGTAEFHCQDPVIGAGTQWYSSATGGNVSSLNVTGNASIGGSASAASLTTTGNATIGGAINATGTATVGALTLGSTPLTLGTGVGNTLGPLTSASGFPKLVTGPRLIFQSGTTSATDVNNFQFDRVASFTGGTSANINSNMRITTTVGANNGSQEWNLLSIVNSSGATGTGLPVAGYFQGNRLSGGKDHQWALIADVKDQSGLSSSASGTPGLVSFELDISANGADDATNSASFGGVGNRTGLDIVAFRYNTGDTTQTQFSHGIWFTTADTHVNYGSAVSFGVNTQTYSALDTRGAIAPTGSSNPVNAVVMSAGHVIDFNGGSSLNSAPSRYLSYSSGVFSYTTSSGSVFSISDTGTITWLGNTVSWSPASGSVSLEFGNPATATTPHIDFHSSGGSSDYDFRLLASGGSGTAGQGTLTLTGSSLVMTCGATFGQSVIMTPRVVTASGAITMTSTDNVLIVNKATGAATAVTLPSSPTTGMMVTVKDGKGDAATNNITVSPAAGTIDGAASATISTNYGFLNLVYGGSQWLSV